jgi:hypothetical protein
VFASYSGIQHVLTIINKVSGDVLSLVYPMLPMSLNCHRSVSCVPNVTNVSEFEDNSETLVTLGTQETER